MVRRAPSQQDPPLAGPAPVRRNGGVIQPADIIFSVQIALAGVAGGAYLLRSLLIGGKMGPERIFQIVAAVASALILPFGTVIIYSAYDPSALDWLKQGNFRLSFLVIGFGAVVYAAANLKNNWPR